MLVRLAIVVCTLLPIGALAVSAAILGVHRNFRGDVFVLRRRNFLESSHDFGKNSSSRWTSGAHEDGKGPGCSAGDCRSGGRQAALIPWRPCQCQCDPSSPTFRQDRGDCVDTIDECRLIPFASSVSTENIPLVFLPPPGHLIYPSAEIALAASMSAFPQMSCHVRRARHLTASGWISVSNITRQKLAFQLVHETGKFFLQYVGTETSRRVLDGQILLVEFACKAANGANIVPDPCSSFRVAGTLAAESFSATPWSSGGPRVTTGSSGSSKRPKDTYVVIGLCAGLLGVMYVLAVLIYLLVRRQQRDKRNGAIEGAARGKTNVHQNDSDPRQNEVTGHSGHDTGQQNSRGNNRTSSSSNEFLSKIRSVIEAARCKLGPSAYLPSLKDIPEETASICDSLDGLDERLPPSTSQNVTKEDRQDVASDRARAPGDRWRDQDAISGNWSALCANPGFMLNRETNVRRSLSANNDTPEQEDQQLQQQLTKKRCRSVSGPVLNMDAFPKKVNIPPPPPLPSFGSSKMPVDSLLKVRKLKPQREEVESPYYSLADTSEEPSDDNRGKEEEEEEQQQPPPLPPKKIRPQGVPLPSMVPAIKRMEKVLEDSGRKEDAREMTVSRGRPVVRNQNKRQQEKLTVIKRSESSVSDNDNSVDYPDDQSSSLRSARSALDVRRSGSSASDTANGRKRQLGFDSGGRPVHGLHSGSLTSVLPRRQQNPREIPGSQKNFSEGSASERRVLVKALVESYNKRQIGGKCLRRDSGGWTGDGKKDEKGIYAASSVSDFGDDSTLERDAASSEGSKARDVGRRRRIGPHDDSGYHSSDSELSSAIRFIQRTATQGQHGGLMAASRVRFSIPEVMMAIDDDDGNEVDPKGDVASNVSDGSFPDSLNGSPLSSRCSAKRFPEAYEFVFTEKL